MSELPSAAVTVKEICELTGYTRQWLNKLADRGEVPGCSRNDVGRLQFEDTAELREWIEKATEKNQPRDSKRAARGRQFDQKPIAPGEVSYRPCDLAKETGLSAKTISRNWDKIPGASVYLSRPKRKKYQVRFKPCAELFEWVAKAKSHSFYRKDYARERESFPNDLHLAVMHLKCATQLLLDYNAKVQAWDLNAKNSVTLADQLENFWESIKPIREGVGMCMEEEEDDTDLFF